MEIKRLRLITAAIVLTLVVAWLLSASAATRGSGFWAVRGARVYLTGIVSIGMMAGAVMLAARPIQIGSLPGGLTKNFDTGGEVGFCTHRHLIEPSPPVLAVFRWISIVSSLNLRKRAALL